MRRLELDDLAQSTGIGGIQKRCSFLFQYLQAVDRQLEGRSVWDLLVEKTLNLVLSQPSWREEYTDFIRAIEQDGSLLIIRVNFGMRFQTLWIFHAYSGDVGHPFRWKWARREEPAAGVRTS